MHMIGFPFLPILNLFDIGNLHFFLFIVYYNNELYFYMNIKIRESKAITVMDIEGRIDINGSDFIEMVGWILKNNKVKILCNFENVELVDYSGLSILAIAYKNVTNHGGAMKFCNVGLHIRELFRVVQMDKIFRCYSGEEEALKAFEEKEAELELKPLRRRFKRIEINIRAAYRPVLVPEKAGKAGKECCGKVVNISGAGIFVATHNLLPVKTVVKLEIAIPKEMVPLEMDGMVIWIADKGMQPQCYPGMGIKFINVDAEKQKELIDFIDKNVTHRSET